MWRGKNAKAQRIANWLNSRLGGNLSRLIHAEPGIDVRGAMQGVSISTSAVLEQIMWLKEDRQPSGLTDAEIALPNASEYYEANAGETQEIYFNLTSGWFYSGQPVSARVIGGNWEVSSPGIWRVNGSLTSNLDVLGSATMDLSTTYGNTSSITVYHYLLTATSGEDVTAGWDESARKFFVDGKRC